jgi:multimeric flavodoxin WrbA
MRVLGILGSPRRGGNAEVLLDRALDGARACGASIEKISLNELAIRPCQECGGCDSTGECVIADDMAMVYSKVDKTDRIILASPIFFGELTAQTKAMIDRFQCRWVKKYRLKTAVDSGKRGAFLCVSAWHKEDFFENAKKIVKIFFVVQDIAYSGDVWCKGISGKGEIEKHSDSLETAFKLGKALVSP